MHPRAVSILVLNLLLGIVSGCVSGDPKLPELEAWSSSSPPLILQVEPNLRALRHAVGDEDFAVGEYLRAGFRELLQAGKLDWSETSGPVPLGRAHLKLQALLVSIAERGPYTEALFELNWRLMSSRGAELEHGRVRAEGQALGAQHEAWRKAAEAAMKSLLLEARRALAPALTKLNEHQP